METRQSKQAEAMSEEMLEKIVNKVFVKFESVIKEQTETLKSLSNEIKRLKEDSKKKDDEIQKLSSFAHHTKAKLDEMEQYGRRNNLQIFGVQESAGEDVDDIIMGLASKLEAPITKSCIDRAHRLGKKIEGKPTIYFNLQTIVIFSPFSNPPCSRVKL